VSSYGIFIEIDVGLEPKTTDPVVWRATKELPHFLNKIIFQKLLPVPSIRVMSAPTSKVGTGAEKL